MHTNARLGWMLGKLFFPVMVALLGMISSRGAAETVTLPVAASVVGLAPFVSDVRVYNTSYTGVVSVTATYRCAPGSAGCSVQPVRMFQLGPRESKAFDNICVSLFGVPNSLGAVEFDASGGGVVVTSRLYSPASSPPWPAGTVGSVGMFIPGLAGSAAKAVTVLTNLANGGSGTGTFRTNVGVYNPNAGGVTATVRVYESASVLLGSKSVVLGGRTGTQISNIYQEVGFGSLVTTNGYATVESDNGSPLFTYAATADNSTQDPVLVVGAEDLPAPIGFHPNTPTPPAGASATPTATRTPTPPAGVQMIRIDVKAWDFSPGGPNSPPIVVSVGTSYRFVFHDVDSASTSTPRHGFSGIERGKADVVVPPLSSSPFTPQPFQRNSYPFRCTQDSPPCGGDAESHNGMLGLLIVQ
jgi:hypothetical protein